MARCHNRGIHSWRGFARSSPHEVVMLYDAMYVWNLILSIGAGESAGGASLSAVGIRGALTL
eukprot:scaffold271197_cov18-Tisochrysis_lutea.AAC.1